MEREGGGDGGGKVGGGLREGEARGGGEGCFEVVLFTLDGDFSPGVQHRIWGLVEDLIEVSLGVVRKKGCDGWRV